ncbi:uncharacterized protein ACBT57_023713 isoform 2-T3 [Dama dama]
MTHKKEPVAEHAARLSALRIPCPEECKQPQVPVDTTGDLTATEHPGVGEIQGPPKLAPRLAWHESAGQCTPALSPHFFPMLAGVLGHDDLA